MEISLFIILYPFQTCGFQSAKTVSLSSSFLLYLLSSISSSVMFVSSQNSHVESLTLSVMVFGGGAFGRYLGSR